MNPNLAHFIARSLFCLPITLLLWNAVIAARNIKYWLSDEPTLWRIISLVFFLLTGFLAICLFFALIIPIASYLLNWVVANL